MHACMDAVACIPSGMHPHGHAPLWHAPLTACTPIGMHPHGGTGCCKFAGRATCSRMQSPGGLWLIGCNDKSMAWSPCWCDHRSKKPRACWWRQDMDANKRPSKAAHYTGWPESLRSLQDALQREQPIDGILGETSYFGPALTHRPCSATSSALCMQLPWLMPSKAGSSKAAVRRSWLISE